MSDDPKPANLDPAAAAHSAQMSPEPPADPAPPATPAEPVRAVPPSAGPAAAPAGKSKVVEPQKEQRANRTENADYMRVLQLFGQIPASYAEHISANGDVIFNVGQSASTQTTPPLRDSAEVGPHEIRLIRAVYQRPERYSQALMALQEQHCVVLRGRSHVGKRAAAIRLALDVTGTLEPPPIRELSPEEDLLAQLAADQIKPGTVYLVDGPLREAARAVKPFRARGVITDLMARQSYLLVCERPDVAVPVDWRTVTLEPPAVSAELLVTAHLDFYGPFESEQVQKALENSAIQEVLKKGLLPTQADQLARQIAQTLRDDLPLETALRGFAAAAEVDVETWFDEAADDIDERAFRVALAAFNGARYVSVADAGHNLAKVLEPPARKESDGELGREKKEESPEKRRSPFANKRRDRLAAARAKLVTRRVATEYSDQASLEVVELEDPSYSIALLKYLWEQLDDLRQPLLNWLAAHAVEGSHDMRLRAAGALGALAGLDGGAFEYMRASVFRPWAFKGQDDPEVRRRHHQALGNAFGVLIWNEQRAEDVIGLLRDWANSDSQPALQWAAARAYAQVGLRYPREAINQWRHILNASKDRFLLRLTDTLGISLPDLPLQMSVVDAIVSLFLRAAEMPHRLKPVYEQALEGLAAWVEADDKDKTAMQAGLPLFLALTPIRLPPEDGSGEPEEWPPAMLYLIGTQPDSSYRRALAAMLRRALNHPSLGPTALEALRFWIVRADQDSWLEKTLTALILELWSLPGLLPREKQRVENQLTRWNRHPKKPLAVAGRILATLHRPMLEDSHGA